jgi:hypothetical protein
MTADHFESLDEFATLPADAARGALRPDLVARIVLVRGVWHNTRMRADGSVVWKHHLGTFSGSRPGERASLSDSAVAKLRSRIPDARIHDFPTGPAVQEADPVLLAGIVDRFLAGGRVRAGAEALPPPNQENTTPDIRQAGGHDGRAVSWRRTPAATARWPGSPGRRRRRALPGGATRPGHGRPGRPRATSPSVVPPPGR